ncbi:MAG TPA: hypothetical protein VJ868_06975 [Actinomycetota bacterium]|nr:hypothetical protein [Actinomycetota bacterium]
MAIKGKRRGRSRPRAVATAPRQFLVPPKTPLFRRTGTQVLLVVLFWAAVFSIVVGFGLASEADRRAQHIDQFTNLVNGALASESVSQSLGASHLILPEMGQAITELRQGRAAEADVAASARDWQRRALAASSKIGRIETEEANLVEARTLMQQGLDLHAAVARQVGVAGGLEGQARNQLLTGIQEQLQAAQVVFDTGYGKLLEERRRAGLPVATGPPGIPGGIPGLPGS